jgi:uncharacterized protein
MLATALLVALQVASVTDVANPRTADRWVTDQANVVSAESEARLDAISNELYQLRGIELAVVTVDSVPGTPKQFATELFNHWKIGSAATNNGVLVLLVMSKRRLEIETGDGMDAALPSQWLADMQAASMVPRFKQKDFGGGLVDGVQAIVDHIKAAPGEGTTTQELHEYRSNGEVTAPDAPRTATTTTATQQTSGPGPAMEYGTDTSGPSTGALVGGSLGLLGLGGGSAALLLRRRRKERTCEACAPARPMLPLGEIEDDQHLEAGQIAEERVGSVDYEVLVCPGCQVSRTLRHGKWFSGYHRCSGCLFKTMKSTSTTLVEATYDHGGQVQVTESCSNCSHIVSYTRHTSARTRPSTTSSSSSGSSFSSSSGGSSFGGGHSSGGGSGSSW